MSALGRRQQGRQQGPSVTPRFLPGILLVLLAPGSACAQGNVAPFYDLPAVGVWVEFDCVTRDPTGMETQSTLRLSHVGRVDLQGKAHGWVEIKLTSRSKDGATWKLRTLLVAVESYRLTGDLAKNVKEAFQQDGPRQPARPLSQAGLSSFLQLGFPETLPLVKSKDEEEIVTPLGKRRCQKVRVDTTIAKRSLAYEAWLSNDMPFGICRFTVVDHQGNKRSQTEFRAVASRTGTMARSELLLAPK